MGCGWTDQWRCPWDDRDWLELASQDASVGYKCCCEARQSRDQPCGGPDAGKLL